MGVIYKLNPEVKNLILEKKKGNPALSCRGLVSLLESELKLKVSKSSVNALFKEAGLSLPVGRRLKKRRRRLIMPLVPLREMPVEKPVTEPEVPLAEKPVEKLAEELVKPAVEGPPEKPTEKPVEEEIKPLPEISVEKPVEVPAEPIKEVPVEKPLAEPAEAAAEPIEPLVERPVEKPVEKPKEILPEKPAEELIPERVEARPEIPAEALTSGAILLKAADCLLNGTNYLIEAIRSRLRDQTPDLLAKIEALLYLPLFSASPNLPLKSDSGLWPLANREFTNEEINSYLNKLQEVKILSSDISRIIVSLFQEGRGVKVSLSDGNAFYLDAQLHTIWSAPQVPYDFSATVYNIRSYINKSLKQNLPFLLFMAPGFDTPTEEFFDFMAGLEIGAKKIVKLIIYGNKFEELENIRLDESKKYGFVIGVWPWQFGQFRRVIKIGDFREFYFAPLGKNFYLAEGQIELTQPNKNKILTLRSCFLKTNLNEKIRLIIISNLGPEEMNLESLAGFYLNRWPNLEEAYQDYGRKIELFTYMATSHHFFSIEELNLSKEITDISVLFNQYLKALDMYVRWHFLPSGYEEKDFLTMKEQIYSLKVMLKRQKSSVQAIFPRSLGSPLSKDLEYACRRLNEKEVFFPEGRRLWFLI